MTGSQQQVLIMSVLFHQLLTTKTTSEMTYTVTEWTLNFTRPHALLYNFSIIINSYFT